jgi:hypothetical protein
VPVQARAAGPALLAVAGIFSPLLREIRETTYQFRARPRSYGGRLVTEAGMSEQQKQDALAHAADLLGEHSAAAQQVLNQLWDLAFEQGQLAALDELQDRLCVCMK